MSFHFVLQVSINVRILPEGCTSDVPLLMRQGFSSIHPALTRPWDLALLVGRVRHLMELVLLPVSHFYGCCLGWPSAWVGWSGVALRPELGCVGSCVK